MPEQHVPNVIVFGEAGAGKSSLVNMLQGGQTAPVSSEVKGGTFSNTRYKKDISDVPFHVFDTAGLNEGTKGTVASRTAAQGLYDLVCTPDSGVNLLVYVMRAPRINETAQQNYRLFFDFFRRKKVPIVIVVTGLENEEDMDKWWYDNRAVFDKHKMYFDDFACVTATKGKLSRGVPMFEEEYNESKKKVADLILRSYNKVPWKMPRTSWFALTAKQMFAKLFGNKPTAPASSPLISSGSLSNEEKRTVANRADTFGSPTDSHVPNHNPTSRVHTPIPSSNLHPDHKTHSWLACFRENVHGLAFHLSLPL